ncbi:shikimate kinase [Tianweitania sp. BSSL-BM11]|uniref:Shikimate kinase n=1 Tax=Tianweitania aestuarii TaxID=2814886 RepID=A0ABS5RZD6_9HYPH|nr:shikimate kinase [Tianweitania aestuarii]MBS9722347.1 shikimate kinase [Tianweitania aestuarii]
MTVLAESPLRNQIVSRLGSRAIVFVGLMGAGKTSIGRRVAQALDLPFVDSDHEIETVSRLSVPELFERYGEPEFRALEHRVIERLVREGAGIVSTGGGAFMNEQTRAVVAEHGISVWLKADLDVLMERVSKRQTRPLLKTADPRATMAKLMDDRYPTYAQSDLTIESRDEKREVITGEVIEALDRFLDLAPRRTASAS